MIRNKWLVLFVAITIGLQANAIVPLINIFTPKTMLPALILTIIIILIETYILRRWAKNISFIQHLKYSTLNNIISSFVGSIFVWIYMMDRPLWEITAMYPIMFIITIVVEAPLLKKEYAYKLHTWKDTIERSLSLHLGSYILIFLLQPIFFIAWSYYGSYLDKSAIEDWKDTTILKHEYGQVYMIKNIYENNNSEYKLHRYDIKSKTDSIVLTDLKMDSRKSTWDIKGKEFAYTGIGNLIYRVDIETKKDISSFKIKRPIEEIHISPDKTMIAILEYEREVNVKKDKHSYYMLGSACTINIYSLESGKLVKSVPRFALCTSIIWDNTSQYIYFVSQHNKDDFFQNQYLENVKRSYGRGYIKDGSYSREIFKYTLNNNEVSSFVKGDSLVGVSGQKLFFIENKSLKIFDMQALNVNLIFKDNWDGYSYTLSPTGKNILMLSPHKSLMAYRYFLIIQNIKDRDKKLMLDKDYNGELRWVK